MIAVRTNYEGMDGKTYQVAVRIMSLNTFYSDFAPVTKLKFPFFPQPNLIFFHKP